MSAHRPAVRGADIVPNSRRHISGLINAEKCIAYLRAIGVEVSDETADSWLDAQATYRFLRSEKTIWRRVHLWSCRCGDMEGFSESGRGRKRPPKRDDDEKGPPERCEQCATGFMASTWVFAVRRDGTVLDYRRGVDAVVPLRLDEWAGGL